MSLNKVNTFAKEVKRMIYHRVQEKNVHICEMTENEIDEMLFDIKHEVLDHELNIMYDSIIDEYLCEYGIQRAYQLYRDNYGIEREVPSVKCVLYHIIDDSINLSFGNYIKWCWERDESDDESDEESDEEDDEEPGYEPTTISNKAL